jgi:hypothetical protein
VTTTRSTPRSTAPWDLSFLRVGALVTGGVAVASALVSGVVAGWDEAVGVLLGAAVVTGFFVISGVVIAWAGRIDDTYTLPAALGAFFVKAVLLYAVLSALPEKGWLDRRTLAFAVVAGALLWSAVQLRWVWTRQLYYVPPPAAPPAPPSPPGDPEGPERRG